MVVGVGWPIGVGFMGIRGIVIAELGSSCCRKEIDIWFLGIIIIKVGREITLFFVLTEER